MSITDHLKIRQQLISKTDREWFDSMCDLLKKESKPTVHQLIDIIGTERPNLNNQIRGSKILDSCDKRFGGVSINPDLKNGEADQPLDYLSFWGENLKLKLER